MNKMHGETIKVIDEYTFFKHVHLYLKVCQAVGA